jgi:hypothetical protein
MHHEYKNFVHKRVDYLINGDPDTPPQTYYTVMIEKIPSSLRSVPALTQFFEKIFPGEERQKKILSTDGPATPRFWHAQIICAL